ncbi:MAG: putative bifunctional diguanylate cyclase/phosphodiesterase [Sciscionella sp.]
MSQRPGAASQPVATAGSRAVRRPGYLWFCAAVLTFGLLGSGLTAAWIGTVPQRNVLWIGPLLLVGFLAAERFTIDLNVRRIDWTVSFTEVPLAIGLLVGSFPLVLLVHLVAGIGAQLRRGSARHLAYNVGVMCLEVAVPFAVYHALRGPWAGAPLWLPAVPGALSSSLVSTLLGLAALRVISGRLRAAESVRLSARTLVIGLLNTAVGLVAYQVVVSSRWGWVLVVLFTVALIPLGVAYARLLREQHDLDGLSEFSLAVARTDPILVGPTGRDTVDEEATHAEWRSVAERIRNQLGVNRVVLHLIVDPAVGVTTVVAGAPLPPGALTSGVRMLVEDPLLRMPGNEARHVRASGADWEIADALRKRAAREVLVVPLRGAGKVLGAVEAHDRTSRRRGFSAADVRVLRTLASHLSTATDNHRLLARLQHDAYHDPPTRLLNRPGFVELAGSVLQRYPESVVLRIELEVLSTVADALGYAWGDRMVVAAGRRLRAMLGEEVPLARLEGGAFAVLLAGHDSGQARQVAERLRGELSAPYPVERLTVEAGAVVGYASTTSQAPGEPMDVDALLQRADVAVRALRSGNESIREYSPAMGQMFLRRFQLVTQFRQALERGEVHVHYQPKIALPGREVLGAEALVRWEHPEFGSLSPDDFVPAVEATGLVDALTDFVADQALAHARKWAELGIRISAAVNVSVRNLADEHFPNRVADALARHHLGAESLTLELTESAVMSDPERALPVLNRLHAMGVVLAVDDFGTGYSSLAYLRQLPVDEVKIDKSFVLGMSTSLGDLAVVRATVELGHSLGLIVVAEGVEDEAVRDQLAEMGCDVAQGYLISRPLSEDRFAAWIQARTKVGKHDQHEGEETVLTLAR